MKKRRLFAGIIMAAVLSSTAFVPSFAAEATAEVVSDSGFTYVHDPRVNSKAMKDIIVNPKAVMDIRLILYLSGLVNLQPMTGLILQLLRRVSRRE